MNSSLPLMPTLLFWASVAVLLYSYVGYPLLLHLLARRFGRFPASDEAYTPTVAIVVPVHNEEKVIGDKLDNIFGLDYPREKISVWVGSDCSTDRTEEIVGSAEDPRVHLWVAPDRSGKSGIINALVPQIDADILVFTDADIMFERDSIRSLVRNFADPEVGGVGGVTARRTAEGRTNEESAYRDFEVRQKTREAMLHSTISAFGPFYAIRRSLFVPFHPHTYSNDDVMMPMNIIRQGYRMYFDPEAVSCEEALPEVKLEFKRRVRIGAGNFQAFFWLLDFLDPRKGWPFFCYVSHKVTRWFSPLFLLLGVFSCGLLALEEGATVFRMAFSTGAILAVASLFHRILPLPLLRHLFYFLAMNGALLLGLFRFLGGIKSAAWSRTERAG